MWFIFITMLEILSVHTQLSDHNQNTECCVGMSQAFNEHYIPSSLIIGDTEHQEILDFRRYWITEEAFDMHI